MKNSVSHDLDTLKYVYNWYLSKTIDDSKDFCQYALEYGFSKWEEMNKQLMTISVE